MRKRLPFLKRASRGQTIVILAFAFIVLLGFVGLVTDISLMFVRYNTLRRAVDAAAVAAAGQVRKTLPTAAEQSQAALVGGTQTDISKRADGYAFARNIATVSLAARQFIEFYGLSPSSVLVDTCATTPADTDLHCGTDETPRKLVKVTAQLQSPTVFLRLLGWNSVQLEASSISETAVLDVVLVFDVAESLANQTSYADWAALSPPEDMHYYAPRMTYYPKIGMNYPSSASDMLRPVGDRGTALGDWIHTWYSALGMTQAQINSDTNTFPVFGYRVNASHGITNVYPPSALASQSGQPRADCRVRFFPAANQIGTVSTGSGQFSLNDNVALEYKNLLVNQGVFVNGENFESHYDGFEPAYNYFGCCNDPNGDFDFSDLVCEPMKDMRDNTEDFLKHIDFTRGDRVALVTFDHAATLIDPDGDGPLTPMITSQDGALQTLRQDVGVRAEGSFYADAIDNTKGGALGADGHWDSFVVGGAPYDPNDPTRSGTPMTYTQQLNLTTKTWVSGGFDNTPLGQLTDYPVINNCRFQNAELPWPNSNYSSPPPPPDYGIDNGSGVIVDDPAHPYIGQRYPTPLAALGQPEGTQSQWLAPSGMVIPPTLMLPNLNNPSWDSLMPSYPPAQSGHSYPREVTKPLYSYEAAAGCGSANVGAGLRVGNNALLNPATVRTNGAVWVMVLLGNAAASSTDPVRRGPKGTSTLITANPYGNPLQVPPGGGQYGAYGLCPYGDPSNPGALVDNNGKGTSYFVNQQPRCSDPRPETRHPFCFFPDDNHTDGSGNMFINLDDDPRCSTVYDADDYARDWADYVALSNPFPEVTTATSTQNRNALQLPTIFTIGFGLNFQQGTGVFDNDADYLGEELMRYIADVGDNQHIDNDTEQDVKADGNTDGRLTNGETTYGDRGPCEAPIVGYASGDAAAQAGDYAALWNPLPPKTSCGNYYWAPDAGHLQQVFDDITARMFTRLTS